MTVIGLLSAGSQKRDRVSWLPTLSCESPVFTAAWSVSEICPGWCQPIRGQVSVSLTNQRSEVRGWVVAYVILCSLITSPNLTFGFGTSLGLGLGIGGLNLGLGLDKKPRFLYKGFFL